MTAIINGSSPSVTFSDGTTQATSAIVSGYVPYANLPAGSVLQVVNATYSTATSTSSSTFSDTGLTATITPKFATSKILVLFSQNGCFKNGGNTYLQLRLQRNGTTLINVESLSVYTNSTSQMGVNGTSSNYLDSPATTSATTYKTQFCSGDNTTIMNLQALNGVQPTSTMTLLEIAQ